MNLEDWSVSITLGEVAPAMKFLKHLPTRSMGFFILVSAVAMLSLGCSDSTADPGPSANPLSVFQPTNSQTGLPTNGTTQGVGQIDKPIVSIPVGSDGRLDHTNAPLLDNWHPGWQQAECLSCHTDQSRIPDHSYTDTSLCYLCHGTNGLPGFGDNIPPIIKNVVAAPAKESVYITWSTDEICITRLILRTAAGDKLEFPVSSEYKQSHKFTVDGLLTGTTYEFEIQAIDRNNNKTTSASFGKLYFTTLAQSSTTPGDGSTTPIPPTETLINGPSIVSIEAFNATAIWKTKTATTCIVQVIDVGLGMDWKYNAGGPATDFSYKIPDLTAKTKYWVIIIAKDITGKEFKSNHVEFTTLPLVP